MRHVITSTLLADGGQSTASALGTRILALRLQVKTATPDDTATEVQKLARELSRPTNLLKTQIGAGPVFFRTFRSAPESWDIVTEGDLINISANVLAEPFAYGLPETPTNGVTISTDPAAVSNPCFVDVTGVIGDVEAPALIRWPSAAIQDGRETIAAVRRRGTPSGALPVFQAEAMTQGTNTTVQANDANFSGAGSNYSRCTFGTATMQTRLSIADLGTASVDLRGRYRVIVRCRKNTITDNINMRLVWGDADAFVNITNDTVEVDPDNTGSLTTVDLGEISVPAGYDPVYDATTGVELVVSDSYRLALQAERTSGSGTLDIDFLKPIPADDRLAIIGWADDSSTATDHWMLNAADHSAHARNASGQVISAAPSSIVGGLPMLTPNQTNRVYLLRATSPIESWALTTVTPVSISYLPRYLSVRPASS
ncbi:MAG: hypothetical protein ACRD0W_01115 [Acidimicrobiales bacterium]